MGVSEFLSMGDVVNLVVTEEAFPFVRDDDDRLSEGRPRNGLQGRVIFSDAVGLLVNSHGGRCMPLFEEDSGKIEISALVAGLGTFFPWNSVVRAAKVTDSESYEAAWEKHERDQQAFHNAKGSWPESHGEFYSWRNSISQAAYDAAYRDVDDV